MKRHARAVLVFSITLIGAGCAAPSPSYGPVLDGRGYGYLDQRLENDRFRVTYRAPTLSEAENGALRRGAEVTLANGAETFSVVSRDVQSERRGSGYGPSVGIGGSTGGYGSGVGIGVQVPLSRPQSPDVTVRLEIITGAEGEAFGTRTYEARDVLSNLVAY